MPTQNDDSSHPLRTVLLCGLVLVILLGIGWWVFFKQPAALQIAQPPAVPGVNEALTDAGRLELWQDKERGVGLLENHKYASAIEPLSQLSAALPNDPLGPRDSVIALLLAMETNPATADAARAAVAELENVQPDAVATSILAAKVLAQSGDAAAAIGRLQQATQSSPQELTLWFELGQLQRDSPKPDVRRQATASFQRAFELAPDNLAVLWNLLQSQADSQQADVVETMRSARPLVEPIAPQATEAGVDLLREIDDALRAADVGRTDDLYQHAFIVANVIKAHPFARRDGLRASPHPLAYVLQDFTPEFYANWTKPQPAMDDPGDETRIVVNFAESPALPQLPLQAAVVDFVVADFDLDERSDLIVLLENRIEVYAGGTQAAPWTKICETPVPPGMQHLLTADLDEDVTVDATPETVRCHNTDLDVVVYGTSGAVIFENVLDSTTKLRSLVSIEQTQVFAQTKNISAAVLFDVDHDALLDLVLAGDAGIQVWQNRSGLKFQLLQTLGVDEETPLPQAMAAVDWDRDIDVDVIMAGEKSPAVEILRNHRHGRFSRESLGEEFSQVSPAVALAVLDADGNGSWDIVTAGTSGVTLIRTATLDAGVVREIGVTQISQTAADGVLVWDYDNDGRSDLLAWNRQGLEIFRGEGSGEFLLEEEIIETPLTEIRQCRVDDVNADGDLDLLIATSQGIAIYDNQGGNQNHWLNIRLLAEQEKGGASPDPGGRVNYHGIGSLLELRRGDQYIPQIVSGQVTHFGLGPQPQVERVRIVWANGFPQNIMAPEADAHICDQKLLLGSCPYLYTWNGEEFVFATDLCWAAPLGLKFADDVYAPSRAWEYLKVDGDQLQPRDGSYQLQVTEELWEAAYFDRISLIAIDHPADVDVFTNEKVGPASMAEHKIHTVRNPRSPVAAHDKRGHDLLSDLSVIDGHFAKPFEQRIKQGLVEDHYLELDLGDLSGAKQIMLYLTGWVYPTDTSLNIRLSRNDQLPSPQSPSLWVPDAEGTWQQTMPYTGFPGGKTKTIAINISDAFLTDDFRLRLATNMEFYWDAVFVTTDEPPAEIRTTELTLQSADLHYRGYSEIEHPTGYGPDRYLYGRLQKDFSWPPMRGHFTRYGDVSELLTATDDRMAIIGSGDEMTLKFALPPNAPPLGWKRDFVMHNVGWDKDANLNTAFGQDVAPLPFNAMSGYPYPDDERYPLTPANRAYLLKYQTRVQDWNQFWRVVPGISPR
ncbi:CRTAC1 family protein [Symmachiella macrocystis]|nr:CRTAC1 family protein [Symmachiella macrocystis]